MTPKRRIPVTVQIPKDLHEQVKNKMRLQHYATTSEYLRTLIRADINNSPAPEVER